MADENNELKDFIQETLRQVREGTGSEYCPNEVKFKVAITKQTTLGASGGLKVSVLGAEGKGEKKNENASTIEFTVIMKSDSSTYIGGSPFNRDDTEVI